MIDAKSYWDRNFAMKLLNRNKKKSPFEKHIPEKVSKLKTETEKCLKTLALLRILTIGSNVETCCMVHFV